MATKLQMFQLQADPLLRRIESLLPDAYRLTLVARHTTNPDAEIILSRDSIPDVIRTLEKHRDE